MSKYINADELKSKLSEYISNKENDYEDGKNEMIDVAKILIAEMPSADVVEVVRCKDCKYIWEHENGCYECGNGFCEVRADFYCADGERKETE